MSFFFLSASFLLLPFLSFLCPLLALSWSLCFRQDRRWPLADIMLLYLSMLVYRYKKKKYDNENRIVSNYANKFKKYIFMYIRCQYMINFLRVVTFFALCRLLTIVISEKSAAYRSSYWKQAQFCTTCLGSVRRNLMQGLFNRFPHSPLGKYLVPRITRCHGKRASRHESFVSIALRERWA